MVTLKISVFVFVSYYELHTRVCVKEVSVDSNIIQSVLFKVLRKVSVIVKCRKMEKRMRG